MSLIGIIFIIAFTFLLAKAILETLWGGVIILQMAFWGGLAILLDIAAFAVRMFTRRQKRPNP